MRKYLVLVCLLGMAYLLETQRRSPAASKDALSEFSAPLDLADAAVQRLREQDVPSFFRLLNGADLPADDRWQEAIRKVEQQRESMRPMSGPSTGEVEFVERETIGKSLVRFVYLEKFERMVMIWRVTFYRARDTWRPLDVDWDPNFKAFFRRSSDAPNPQ